eukprot:GILK01004461.1.p1 GENE.GILK01004461.1~~GILK01004461.1.p1  ORF type:complete len:1299 (+),score=306.15 GILK01004461.1:63-3959(+)
MALRRSNSIKIVSSDAGEAATVAVRVRPLSKREKKNGGVLCVQTESNSSIAITNANNQQKRSFQVDQTYWSASGFTQDPTTTLYIPQEEVYADQKKIFSHGGVPLVDNLFSGVNSYHVAYGETGSGKSFSTFGQRANRGLAQLCCEDIFKRIVELNNDRKYEVTVSMLELYNEKVQDLLRPPTRRVKGGLRVRESDKAGVFVEGLKKHPVADFPALTKKIREGVSNRTMASTLYNSASSRTHVIMTVELTQRFIKNNQMEHRKATLTFVDLAGSEKAVKAGQNKDRFAQATAINQSLTALRSVLFALATGNRAKKTSVPYRSSMLTRLLHNALGGNARTYFLFTLSPSSTCYEESLGTLRYAELAKKMRCNPINNQDSQSHLLEELKTENDRLRRLLVQHQGKPPANDEIEQDIEQWEEELRANELAIAEISQTWEEKVAAAEREAEAEQDANSPTNENMADFDEDEDEEDAPEILAQPQQAHGLTINAPRMSISPFITTNGPTTAETSFGEADKSSGNQLSLPTVAKPVTRRSISNGERLPQLSNINEDPQLSGRLVFNIARGVLTAGKKTADNRPDIVLAGLGIELKHCKFINEDNRVTLEVEPSASENTLVNGKRVIGSRGLRHGDRLMLGTNYVFLFKNPAREDEKESGSIAIDEIDWEFAQKEVALASGLTVDSGDSAEADADALIRAEEAEQKLKELELKAKAERDQQQKLLDQQRIEYERRIEQLENEKSYKRKTITIQIKGEQTPQSAVQAIDEAVRLLDEEMKNKEIALARELEIQQRKIETDLKEKEKLIQSQIKKEQETLDEIEQKRGRYDMSYLDPILTKMLPMVHEGNLIAKELSKKFAFKLKIITNLSADVGKSPLTTLKNQTKKGEVIVDVHSTDDDNNWVWDCEKFETRLLFMRELLNNYEETKQIEDLSQENDPFWDPPTSHLIGHAHIYLKPLGYKIEIESDVSIVNSEGQRVGSLHIAILPNSNSDGNDSDEEEFVDSPADLLGQKLDFSLNISHATGLPEKYSNWVYCRYKFFLDETYETPAQTVKSTQPQFNYTKNFVIHPVTESFLKYLDQDAINIEIFGYADAAIKQSQNVVAAKSKPTETLTQRLSGVSGIQTLGRLTIDSLLDDIEEGDADAEIASPKAAQSVHRRSSIENLKIVNGAVLYNEIGSGTKSPLLPPTQPVINKNKARKFSISIPSPAKDDSVSSPRSPRKSNTRPLLESSPTTAPSSTSASPAAMPRNGGRNSLTTTTTMQRRPDGSIVVNTDTFVSTVPTAAEKDKSPKTHSSSSKSKACVIL